MAVGKLNGALIISIHAPTRGATIVKGLDKAPLQFQSTLPRGERLQRRFFTGGSRQFQSTLPRGERHARISDYAKLLEISIHAPTRGATVRQRDLLICMQYFNPRSHEGSDRSP